MQKLTCYIDETGQDRMGKIFIVSAIIQQEDLDLLRKQLEKIERDSGKGRRKWMQTRPESKVAYLRLEVNFDIFVSEQRKYEEYATKRQMPLWD